MNEPVGDLHIDDFCKDVAKTMLILYKRFPTKTALFVEDIAGPDEPDEFGLHSARFEAGFSALMWLKDTDYIHFSSTMKQEAVEEAVLSHRAFCLLSALDQELVAKEVEVTLPTRRIDRLKAAYKDGNSERLKEMVLGLMLKSRDYI